MSKLYFISVLLILFVLETNAQNTFLPINSFTNYYTDRIDISGISNNISTSLKPISRSDFSNLLKNKDKNYIINTEKHISKYINNDNVELYGFDTINEKSKFSIKNTYYRHASALFSINKKDFVFVINPVFGFSSGIEGNNFNEISFQNTRGLEVRGKIDKKIGFYSFITENQIKFPSYYSEIIENSSVIPGYGFYKESQNKTAYDFFLARGYITFSPSKHIGMQFGQDRNFIGNGYRSLILSDFSNPYLFLKINTKIWKFNYQNLYAQLNEYNFKTSNGKGVSPKYFVNHYLNYKVLNNLSIGFFESVLYDRSDSIKNGYFDINYLNPVIFYRAVEHNLNSSDNVMVGTDWKWNIKKRFSFYGQFVLDEFIKDEMVKLKKSWVNKFGIQTGLKYINAFNIKYLDLQAEYNIVRPYMYMHFKKSQNYINYNQPLAHPLGANFKEAIFIIKYQPAYKFYVESGLIYIIKGLDSSNISKINYGGNILRTYDNRPKDIGIKINDGIKTNYTIFFINASYMVYHNMYFDLRFLVRNIKSEIHNKYSDFTNIQLGFRMNLNLIENNF